MGGLNHIKWEFKTALKVNRLDHHSLDEGVGMCMCMLEYEIGLLFRGVNVKIWLSNKLNV